MTVVALDTSALMAPVELDLRVFDELDRLLGEHELVAPRAVRSELARLAEGASAEARAARVGLDLLERCRVIEGGTDDDRADAEGADGAAVGNAADELDGNADDALVALAREGLVDYVVTTDRPLRDRLLAVNTPVVGVRGRNTLAVTEP